MNFLLVVLFLGLFQAIAADTTPTCDIFHVLNGQTPYSCVEPGKNNDTSTFYNLQQCSDDKMCPFNSYFKSNHTVTCAPKKDPFIRYYPGQICSVDNDCYTQKCKEGGVCAGTDADQPCENNFECYHGYTCIPIADESGKATDKSKCQKQKNGGEKCFSDTDCINTHGCHNNNCTEYFSVANNVVLSNESEFYKQSGFSFCASGFSLDKKCLSIKNTKDVKTTDCGTTTACDYTLADSTTVSIPNSCECTFHADGLKRCKLDTESDVYKRFVSQTKSALASLRNCYSDERTVNCKGYTKKPYVKDFNTINDWKFSKWLVDNAHKVINLSDAEAKAVYNVTSADLLSGVVPQPNPSPEANPDNSELHRCPAFTCTSENKGSCAYMYNPSSNDWYNMTVNLTNICNKDQICNLPLDNPLLWLTGEKTKNITCVDKKNVFTKTRYPGEDCDANNACYKTACGNDKICPGAKEGQPCDELTDCWVGFFCLKNATAGVCTAQRDVGGDCSSKYDCKNNLLCNNGKCAKMFSLDDGATVNTTDTDKSDFCKSGRANDQSNKCVKRTLDMERNAGDTAKCIPGSNCKYSETDGTTTYPVFEKCACGFNANRNAYCPIDDTKRVDQWNDYRSSVAKTFDNNCHSFSRNDCYKNDQKLFKNTRVAMRDSKTYHLLVDPVSCAKDLLSSSFINFSMVLLTALFAALLF